MFCATPVVIWFAGSFYQCLETSKHRSANMDYMVALSTGIVTCLAPSILSSRNFWEKRGLHAHVYFEASSVIIIIYFTWKLLEEKAKASTSSALKKLIGLQPKTVTIIHETVMLRKPPLATCETRYIILAKPGEKIPVTALSVKANLCR